MQVSTQVMTREKNVAANKNFILRKMGLKFQNPKPCLVRQLRKIVIFIRKKISDYMKPTRFHHPRQPGKWAGSLRYDHIPGVLGEYVQI